MDKNVPRAHSNNTNLSTKFGVKKDFISHFIKHISKRLSTNAIVVTRESPMLKILEKNIPDLMSFLVTDLRRQTPRS